MAFGVHHTPKEFVQEAVKAGHPSHRSSVLPQALEEAIAWNMEYTPKQLCHARLQTLAIWSQLAEDLHKDEQDLHATLPKHAKPIMKGKRILLWKHLLEQHGMMTLQLWMRW